jgi:stearoyl-CoA desaturase (delta-9 desaturase)
MRNADVSAAEPKKSLSIPSAIRAWFDSDAGPTSEAHPQRIDVARIVPFIAIHLACLCVIWVGWSPVAVFVGLGLYVLRMFAITGFYHRYFSHKAFQTSRVAQFVFAALGAMAVQRGPLWWAAHHRHHHAHSDQPEDAHSPRQHGFLWSHMGWFLARGNYRADSKRIRDLERFPELRWLDRYDIAMPVLLAVSLFVVGAILERTAPNLRTTGAQLLIWGFFVSTVVCYHATYTINSLSHVFGGRRYKTPDDSRNNVLLALLTLGEGWHNNHHHYPKSARQGFFWWEIDLTYYLLRVLSWIGVIWDLQPVPATVRNSRRLSNH